MTNMSIIDQRPTDSINAGRGQCVRVAAKRDLNCTDSSKKVSTSSFNTGKVMLAKKTPGAPKFGGQAGAPPTQFFF